MDKKKQYLKEVFSIYDTKALIYFPPQIARNRGEMLRDFTSWANNEKTNIGKYPTDHVLYFIGYYDEYTGEMQPQKPEALGHASDYVEKKINTLNEKTS